MKSYKSANRLLKPFQKSLSVAISLGLIVSVFAGCSAKEDNRIQVTLIQINDVYEIEAVSGGKLGGLARVAYVRKQLLKENPNTFTVMAGDFFSPSALGTAVVDGKRLDGKQMVAVLNAMGLDYAAFGNHEFDIKKDPFYSRLNESEFKWIACNVFDKEGNLFPGTLTNELLSFSNHHGSVFTLGLTGITMDENDPEYVSFSDPVSSIKAEIELMQDHADAIIAITHFDFVDDQSIAEKVPEIDLIIGGHDHENILLYRGKNFTPIAKADANAKSIFIHRLSWDPDSRSLAIDSSLMRIDETIPEDPETAGVIKKWVNRGFEGFKANGFQPNEIFAQTTENLDGREASIRYQTTNLTRLIGDSIRAEVPNADLGIFNSGSIRLDDKLSAGPISQYDVLRVLPFPGKVLSMSVKGSQLMKMLDRGLQEQGNGSFLQTSSNVSKTQDGWSFSNQPLNPDQYYTVAVNDFLANGRERVYEYFDIKKPSSELKLLETHRDVRLAVINELKKRYPLAQ